MGVRIIEPRRICKTCGKENEIESYRRKSGKRMQMSRECRGCRNARSARWRSENHERFLASKKWIPDDDPETDLSPMLSGGYVRWAVITTERRVALGERSPLEPGSTVDAEVNGV